MPQPLNLSRAARLAGVTRNQLQKRIRDEGIETFEGQITISDLLAMYPDVNLERDPVFERIERLKAKARPKSEYSDGWMPDAEVLMTRLKDMHGVLARTRTSVYRHEETLRQVLQRLDSASMDQPEAMATAVVELRDWLTARLESTAHEQDARAELFARDAFFKVLAPSVRIASSGHQFHVEGRDTLLEAALKAGLHLSYGCSSGNCGACKTRVVSGKAKQVKEHDYLLSPRELESGLILACSWTAVTDLVIDATEALTPADLPQQEIRAGVRSLEKLTPDLMLLSLQTPRSQTLRFMAGQSVELSDEDGNRASYPIASCPCDGGHLQFFIRHSEEDPFSQAVFGGRIKEQVVTLIGPMGDFVLQEESTAPALFVAVGDGFAPLRSLIEHAIAIEAAEKLDLYLVQGKQAVPFVHNLCRAWDDALDNFHLITLPADSTAQSILERVLADHPDVEACELYIAGPRGTIEPLVDLCSQQERMDKRRLHSLILD